MTSPRDRYGSPGLRPTGTAAEVLAHDRGGIRLAVDESPVVPLSVDAFGDLDGGYSFPFLGLGELPKEPANSLLRRFSPCRGGEADPLGAERVAFQKAVQAVRRLWAWCTAEVADMLFGMTSKPPLRGVDVKPYHHGTVGDLLHHPADLFPRRLYRPGVGVRPDMIEEEIDLDEIHSGGREIPDIVRRPFFPRPPTERNVGKSIHKGDLRLTVVFYPGTAVAHRNLGIRHK